MNSWSVSRDAIVFASCALLASGAAAQTPGTYASEPQSDSEPRASPAGGGNDSSEIVVTALRRSVSVQNIPASISAVSGDTLLSRGVTDTLTLGNAIPGLVFVPNFGNTIVTIRGVGSTLQAGSSEPTVAIYSDGAYLPRPFMGTLRAVDLDRVEVLRGPQGTLYGRNATGGAVNFISAAPTKTWTGRIDAFVGGRNQIGVSGFVSGPLADGVEIRLSGGREKQDGPVENIIKPLGVREHIGGGTDAKYGRVALRLAPTSSLTVDLSLRYDEDRAPKVDQSPVGPISIGVEGVDWTTKPWKAFSNRPHSAVNRLIIGQANLAWEASDEITVKSLTNYILGKTRTANDDDGTAVPYFYTAIWPRRSESISQEFNVLGDFDKFNFILGAFYYHEKYKSVLDVIIENPNPAAVLTQNLGQSAKVDNFAAFADATYSFTDALRLNLGLRLNYDKNQYESIAGLEPIIPTSTVVGGTIKKTRLLPKVALQYDFTPEIHSYLQWSRGYKGGGGNLPASDGSAPPFGPETLDSYEVGLKSRLLDGKLTTNLAAFYYDYSGLQVEKAVPPIGVLTDNAQAKAYGAELEVRYSPVPDLTFTFAPTYVHTEFTNFTSIEPLTLVPYNLAGKVLTFAPKWTVNASASKRFDLGGELLNELELTGNVRHNSTVVFSYFDLGALDRQRPYTLFDLNATISDADKKTTLSLFVNNVANKAYKNLTGNFGIGYIGHWGLPRTWGARLSRSF